MASDRPSWPEGKSCAVTLTFDNFGEAFDLLRYGHAGGANADGVYAPRRGVERVMDLLERYGLRGTFFLEGWNVRKYAGLAREIHARGHEIAAHGWMHERWSELDLETERDLIRRTTETIAEVVGKQPRGWRSPSGLTTRSTLRLLHDAGYRYDSSMGDEDVPYEMEVEAGDADRTLIELPWSWPLDDAAYFAYPGAIRKSADVADIFIEEYDAAKRLTGNYMLVCHPRFIGRPARILALERVIDHIVSSGDAWVARCDEVADHARQSNSLPHYEAPEHLREGSDQ